MMFTAHLSSHTLRCKTITWEDQKKHGLLSTLITTKQGGSRVSEIHRGKTLCFEILCPLEGLVLIPRRWFNASVLGYFLD